MGRKLRVGKLRRSFPYDARHRSLVLLCAAGLLVLGVFLSELVLPPPASISPQATYDPWIRIALTNSPLRSLSLKSKSPVTITAANSNQMLSQTEKLPLSEVTATPNGIRIGDLKIPATRIELRVEEDLGLWINKHLYRGRVQIYRMKDGRLRVVNYVRLENYLASVVDSEMPIEFGREARIAQCIAARTYAIYQLTQRRTHPYFDLYANTRSQMYLGVEYPGPGGQRWAGESRQSREIVNETRGEVCTHNERIFCTYFSAACGGRTVEGRDLFSDAAAPVTQIDCQWCSDAKLHRWEHRLSLHRFLQQFDREQILSTQDSIQLRDSAPSILDVEPRDRILLEQQGVVLELQRYTIQQRLGARLLPSPLFQMKLEGEDVVFEGRGHGHGVGFCQWGARGQAQSGRDGRTILQTYYPGTKVVRILAPPQ